MIIASPKPVSDLRLSEPLPLYGRRSKNARGRLSAAPRLLLLPFARIGELLDALVRASGKWWPHCGQTRDIHATRRRGSASAAGAGVRVWRLAVRLRRRLLVLDRDVDARLARRDLRSRPVRARAPSPTERPQARWRVVSGEPGEACAAERSRLRDTPQKGSTSSSVGPPGSGMNTASSPGPQHVGSRATYTRSAPSSARSNPSSMPVSARNCCSPGSRLRAPTSATSSGSSPSRAACAAALPQALPDGDVAGVFRSP